MTSRCYFILFTFDEDFHLSTKQEVGSCLHKLDIQCTGQDFIIRPLLQQLTDDFEILKRKIFGDIETISVLDWDAACESDQISHLDFRKLGDLQLYPGLKSSMFFFFWKNVLSTRLQTTASGSQ